MKYDYFISLRPGKVTVNMIVLISLAAHENDHQYQVHCIQLWVLAGNYYKEIPLYKVAKHTWTFDIGFMSCMELDKEFVINNLFLLLKLIFNTVRHDRPAWNTRKHTLEVSIKTNVEQLFYKSLTAKAQAASLSVSSRPLQCDAIKW